MALVALRPLQLCWALFLVSPSPPVLPTPAPSAELGPGEMNTRILPHACSCHKLGFWPNLVMPPPWLRCGVLKTWRALSTPSLFAEAAPGCCCVTGLRQNLLVDGCLLLRNCPMCSSFEIVFWLRWQHVMRSEPVCMSLSCARPSQCNQNPHSVFPQ